METGTVIHGTLRTQDLLPVFYNVLISLDPEEAQNTLAGVSGIIPVGDDSHEWWGSEECVEIITEVVDCINRLCEPGIYFGAHPGDGCDFGFWEYEEEI